MIPDRGERSIYSFSDAELLSLAGNEKATRWARECAKMILSDRDGTPPLPPAPVEGRVFIQPSQESFLRRTQRA